MSIKGSPYANFSRALETRKLSIVLAAATELQSVRLDDALEILALMARDQDPALRQGSSTLDRPAPD